MATLIVDGTNVMGARADGWWRDRPAAAARLVADLTPLVESGDSVTVVFDGRPSADLDEGVHAGVRVLFARRSGPDAADDRVVEEVEAHEDPSVLLVVTSDRALRGRVEALGAATAGARSLLDRISG